MPCTLPTAPAKIAVVAAFVVTSFGCAGPSPLRLPNRPPTVELTQAPVIADHSTPYFYAYRIFWSGNDPDGRVDHYLYAIDPPNTDQRAAGAETIWVSTPKNEEIFFFKAIVADTNAGVRPTASDFHVFLIKAVDNEGAESEFKTRAFYSYTIAPSVQITNPAPTAFMPAQVTPSVRITWTGSDPDGQFTQKPVQYKYKLFPLSEAVNRFWMGNGDSLRRFYAPSNFAGWDSIGGDTTTVQYTNLVPSNGYLFVVIAYDEAGAYSPVFTLDSNMLWMEVGYASTLGPILRVFNSFIDFTYPSGGYSNDPLRWINVEVPRVAVTFNWEAAPPPGSIIESYRWALDLSDLTDRRPRTDEETDWYHWSRKSNATKSATFGPLTPGAHLLYIEAADNNGLVSLGVVHITVVEPTFDKPLLIVDDTRREYDQLRAGGCLQTYKSDWPSATELDTFLYARGGVPWRCTISPASGVLSQPGLFAGYDFDTLNTRIGKEIPSFGVLLSKIGEYKRIIWMVDIIGAKNMAVVDNQGRDMSVLRYMSAAGRASTLAAFVQLGGEVWLAGGGASYATLIPFDKAINNTPNGNTVFDFAHGELLPGRLMFDAAHWQVACATAQTITGIAKSNYPNPGPMGGWTHHNFWPQAGSPDPLRAPNYDRLPATMRLKSPDTDPMPPTRVPSQPGGFYVSTLGVEYIVDRTFIIEDVDPSPTSSREIAVLDTLYEANGATLLGPRSREDNRAHAPVMTYYHGTQSPRFVFSGFPIWNYARADALGLVDFVLQEIWGLPRQPIDRGIAAPAGPAPAPRPDRVLTPAQRTLAAGSR